MSLVQQDTGIDEKVPNKFLPAISIAFKEILLEIVCSVVSNSLQPHGL